MTEENNDPNPSENPSATTPPASTPEVPSNLIADANAAAARLEAATIEHAKVVASMEALKVQETLGGKAVAGVPQKEETPEEYAKKVMANDL